MGSGFVTFPTMLGRKKLSQTRSLEPIQGMPVKDVYPAETDTKTAYDAPPGAIPAKLPKNALVSAATRPRWRSTVIR